VDILFIPIFATSNKLLGEYEKIFLFMAMLVGVLAAQAEEYTYLTFEMMDGTKASVPVEGLTLNISGTTLTAGSQTFNLSDLSKMYFSNSNEQDISLDFVVGVIMNPSPSEDDLEKADINGDGKVDAADLVTLTKL
jgi:hypothetical protein